MPFHVCAMPPIGLSQLKAVLAEAGIGARVYNFNLEFLPAISADLDAALGSHDEISYLWDFLPGEWLFTSPVRDDAAYLRALRERAGVRPEIVDLLSELRARVAPFVARCASRLALAGHEVVGFTSSFMQTQPAVAVARQLRKLRPQLPLMFGGSNAFGPMGTTLLRQVSEFDVAVHGEAEDLIVPLVQALRTGDMRAVGRLPGISYRIGAEVTTNTTPAPAPRLDALPMPDYDDYYETLHSLRRQHGGLRGLPQFLPIETSRGCWWGAKSHCTFCGLNADRMTYRSKSPERALREFRAQVDRYAHSHFFCVDNILDHRYYESVLPELARDRRSFFIHYEIKANLKRSQVERLRAAGVHKVQPGIESLSTEVLKLMRKGISAAANVQALKWLTEHELRVTWHLLYGFPRERLEHYEELAQLLPKLMHLAPPKGTAPVYLERFSPYHSTPEAFGITLGSAVEWYRWAFPEVPLEELDGLAYRFDFVEPARDRRIDAFVAAMITPLVQQWSARYAAVGCTLGSVFLEQGAAVVCGPFENPERVILLDEDVAQSLRTADGLRTASSAPLSLALLGQRAGRAEEALDPALEPPLTRRESERFLRRHAGRLQGQHQRKLSSEALEAQLVDAGLMMREGKRVLALPVDWTRLARRACVQPSSGVCVR